MILSSIPLIYYMPILMPVLVYWNFVVHFILKKYESSKFVLLFKIALAILDSLHFHINFRSTFYFLYKRPAGIFIGIALICRSAWVFQDQFRSFASKMFWAWVIRLLTSVLRIKIPLLCKTLLLIPQRIKIVLFYY